MQNLALLQLLDWLLDGKGSLTLDGRLKGQKRGKSHSKTWGSFLVAQNMVLSHRAKFQLIKIFFRVKAISTGLKDRADIALLVKLLVHNFF